MALTSYIAIDSGGSCGWAQFSPLGYLMRPGLAHPPFTSIPRGDPLVIIEKPHGGRGKASRVDIATLARRMQMVLDHLKAPVVKEVFPRWWKGTIDKEIMTRRIYERWMTEEERRILSCIRARKNHNVIDSIGIGIKYAAVLGLRTLP